MKMFDEKGDTKDIFHKEEMKWVEFVDEENKPTWEKVRVFDTYSQA